ncbi:MAG: hypothetical protein HYX63_13895 [Gammaproteobacteria bacterium]|nr:hypothetical protein [Gammaproteobacteria bacterium]
MVKPTPKPPIPRAVTILLPPVVAILAAWFYTNWQVQSAEREMAQFCAGINTGTLVPQFVQAALARNFTVAKAEPEASLTASVAVYRLKREIFTCTARHEGEHVLSAALSHTSE